MNRTTVFITYDLSSPKIDKIISQFCNMIIVLYGRSGGSDMMLESEVTH